MQAGHHCNHQLASASDRQAAEGLIGGYDINRCTDFPNNVSADTFWMDQPVLLLRFIDVPI